MTLIWVAALALTILLYVLLDGFDLGVGILFLFSREEINRRRMLAAISPVWDGNETWLVLTATILFGAFSPVFALVLSALYLPVIVGVSALILRGVAFEFRDKATKTRGLWDAAFAVGSLVATLVQGMAIGALAAGLPQQNGQYTGGIFGWVSPFSMLCGLGLCAGYTLLGAAWLVKKCDGQIRDAAYRLLPWLVACVVLFGAVAFGDALAEDMRILNRWRQEPYLALIPIIGAAGAWGLIDGVRRRRDDQPYLMASMMCSTAFAAVAVSFWPYMVPFSMTIENGASPPESAWFLFWGAGLIAFPLTLGYTMFVYRVFRGKVIDVEYD
jgi:cytochrome d ubiquinol oxidase subunit II